MRTASDDGASTPRVTTLELEHEEGRHTRYRLMMPARRGRWPLVLFSHGANSASTSYDRLWHVWAARGFAILAPDHIDSGPPATQAKPPAAGLWASRLADCALPLHQRAPFDAAARAAGGALDWTRVAAAGHSFGAVVAQGLAGARLTDPQSHAPSPAREAAVRACLAFSPPGPLPGFVPDDAWAGIRVPCLLQTGDADRLPGFVDDWHSRLTGFAALPDRWTLVGHGVDHYFGGLICRLDPAAGAQSAALNATASLSATFLDAYLKGEARAAAALARRADQGDDGTLIVARGGVRTSLAAAPVLAMAALLGGTRRLPRRQVLGGALAASLWPTVGAAADPPAAAIPSSDTVTIGGARVPRALPRAELPRVAADALAAAQAFSDSYGGTALLVMVDGRLDYERYAAGFDATTRLKTYSMAKSMLGIVYGLAVARGIVALEDPIGRHVVEWRNDPRGRITLHQLLQMRSGLKLDSLAQLAPKALELVIGRHVTQAALDTPLVATPGAAFEYNNVNSFLAGLALDRALGRAGQGRYTAFLSRALWRPLGQADATMDVEFAPSGEPRFFAGFDATARDWARIGGLFVDRGRVGGREVVSAAWLAQMTTPSPNPVYGLQMWIGRPWSPIRRYGPTIPSVVPAKDPYAAPDLVFFDGAGGQRVYMVPSRRLVIVRTGAIRNDWEDSTVPNAILRGLA